MPTTHNNFQGKPKEEIFCEPKGNYPCPCCGNIIFTVSKEEVINYPCPVCYWEYDVFIINDDEPSDLNHGITLNQGRKNYNLFGACYKNMLPFVRKPNEDEIQK